MRMGSRFFYGIFLCIPIIFQVCFAQTEVVLSDGTRYIGTVSEETETYLVLQVEGQGFTIFKTMIASRTGDGDAGVVVSTVPQSTANTQQAAPTAPVEQQQARPAPTGTTDSPSIPQQILATSPQPALAERRVSLGINLSYEHLWDFYGDYTNKQDITISGNRFSVNPFIGIRVGKRLELRPSIGFERLSGDLVVSQNSGAARLDTSSGSSTIEATIDSSALNLSAEFSIFIYLIREGPFRLSIGPSLYYKNNFQPTMSVNDEVLDQADEYINMYTGLKIPFNFDIILKNRFGFKISGDILSVMAKIDYVKVESKSRDKMHLVINSNLSLGWPPSLGIFILF
jgi:hypothetical protein